MFRSLSPGYTPGGGSFLQNSSLMGTGSLNSSYNANATGGTSFNRVIYRQTTMLY